jgi:Rap1a immunity proteins
MLKRWLPSAASLLAVTLLQPLLLQQAAAQPYSAEEMLSQCQQLLATAKRSEEPDSLELDNTFATGTCWGAFLGIQQLATLKIAGAHNPLFRLCVPEDTTLVQFIQLFDIYARRHPERQSEPFTVVALAALHEAFLCRK